MANQRIKIRNIFPFKDYFKEFKKGLARDVLMKIYEVFMFIMTERIIPVKFFRKIEGKDNLYEIRVEHGSNIYRIFCCMDEGNLIILFNGFQKKTQKTPSNQIARAERIKKEYFEQKAETIKK